MSVNERMSDKELQAILDDIAYSRRYTTGHAISLVKTERLVAEVIRVRAELLKVTKERDAWEKKFWEARWRVQELPTVNGTYGSVELYAALKAIDSVTSEAPEQGEPAKPLADPVEKRGYGCNRFLQNPAHPTLCATCGREFYQHPEADPVDVRDEKGGRGE